ncbi:tetratricopeptide repeat protein [Luteolibacter marinus]|uniref:tetratricopeptide repeat protein n=1 Tax=Luteolibacter marinus TaxID=2776705 RepID=UPI001865D7F3|nr:tetratricopeptide repeat protein [Luteolibacter marinus]
MSTAFTRARQLRQHRRHEEAVGLLLGHLAQDPDDPHAYLELALNRNEIQGARQLALEDARKATGLLPGHPFPLALQSNILSALNREKEALPLAESAIALDPEETYARNAKTVALCGLSRWRDAEENARHTLELDPDDETASNLLAHALRLQNKLDESARESRRRLERDPENAFSFSNAGWAALQRHQVQEAENHFKEALRLDPELEHAREGLKQSYRARSGFYRMFLRWAFFMQRFNEKNRTLILIALVIGFRVVRNIAAAIHPLLVIPVVLIYYIFLFGTWLSSGIANLLILKDPVARMSLDRGEKAEGVAVGILFFGGLVLLVAGMALGMIPLAVAGVTMMLAAIPSTLVFTNESKKGRLLFGSFLVAILALGGYVAIDLATHPGQAVGKGNSGPALGVGVLLTLATTWLSMVPSLRNEKPT